MAKTKKMPAQATATRPRADINGWILCPGDNVLIISPGEEHHGLFGKVDAFPTTLELSSYVQIDGRPSTSGRVLLPNAQLRWMSPSIDHLDRHRPTRPGQQVRVVLENETLATPEMRKLDGMLGTTTELGPSFAENQCMVTVKFDDESQLPTAINSIDLLVVPIAVVHYVPEPAPITSADIEEAASTPTATTAPVYTPTKMKLVALADIIVTSNTRKVFDETALAELANSIKAQGVIAPITVRPHGTEAGKFELVAGERRYRASKLAEQVTIPAVIRTLTDREFLEVQLLENLQRVDVRPADEAQAFAQLLKNGYSAEEIGLKVGKGAKFVAQRAKLAALMPFWLDALIEERLPLVAATEIARLPDESQSRLEEVAMRDYSLKQAGAIFKAEWIKGAIKSYVLRELNAAAFPKHDAQLCPAAGACTTCPKRSGAVKQLFDEEELKHDYCLDGACFEQKKEAFVVRQCATLKQATGKPAVRISTDYYQVPKGTLDCYSYKEAKEGAPEAVQAVVVNGSEMGQLKWVVVRAGSGASKSEADKEADAKRLRTERLTKTHRALIAEKLTIDLPAAMATQSPVYESILTYLLLEECSSAKETLAYLRESWGWEPDEAALKDDYNDKDARGFRPWKRFVLEMVGPLSLEQKLEMYLALKVRHRMHYDYEDRQFTIAKLVAGHGYPELAAEAEQAVELRYYTRKGKKQEATV